MSSSVHIDNKDVLILGERPTQGLDDKCQKLNVLLIYRTKKTRKIKIFELSPHYNGSNSSLFVNVTIICQFQAKCSEIKDYTLCLGNNSKDFTINNMNNRIKKNCQMFSSYFITPLILMIF